MNAALYDLIVDLIDGIYWNGELRGEENLPEAGPVVLVGNHLDAAGPIGVVCCLGRRLYPWIKADMMDAALAPEWLRQDFTARQLHLKPPFDRWLAGSIADISVPMFRSLDAIPVYGGDPGRMQETFEHTLKRLLEGAFVLVFPEDNLGAKDPATGMQPFQHSFVRLGERYYGATAERLKFIPVATHGSGVVRVGQAVSYSPFGNAGTERRRVKNILEQDIRRMYLEAEAESARRQTALLKPKHLV